METRKEPGKEEIIKTACCSHCAGTCLLEMHVKDGVITAIETDETPGSWYRSCLKGHAWRQLIYHPDRLLYPLRRVGERGEGKFERISWGEALDTVAKELKRVKETYGNGAIMLLGSGGDTPKFHYYSLMQRLLGLFGGYTTTYGTHSYEGGTYAAIATYGTIYNISGRDNFLHSKLIILWGCNPVGTSQATGTSWHLVKAKEAGTEIISVDPKMTNTVTTFADQWIPIRPSTDTAMMVAMAYVIIKENLQDQAFLDRYTVGFEKFKQYVMGDEDGIPKTPSWAERITGVSASTIEELARKYATMKPAALIDGISAGRTAYGEQYHRAAIVLAAMTGNIGIVGGNAPSRAWAGGTGTYPYKWGPGIPGVDNPYDKGRATRPFVLKNYEKYGPQSNAITRLTRVSSADAILKGRAGGYPEDYKLVYMVNYNYLNQILNLNKTKQALKKPEFFVTQEQFMTPTAKWADIILPTNTRFERNDLVIGHDAIPSYGYLKKIIEPLGESKSHFEICIELAKRLGITNFADKTEDEYIMSWIQGAEIPDAEAFKKNGIYQLPFKGPYIAFQKQIQDPEHNPFPTPSGKIEIFSQEMADMDSPLMPPVPKYIEPWEGPNDPLTKKYPLQMVTSHISRRAHSQYEKLSWLMEIDPQVVTINTGDAEARCIRDGETVRVFNDRGETRLPARVTGRIMPGVVDIPEGAWYDPDENGIDRGGNPNMLTKDETSPGGAYPSNTSLVEVARV